MDYKRTYVTHIGKFLRGISHMLFPIRNRFNFREIRPEELFKSLPRSKNLSGATALTDRQKIYAVLSYKNRITRLLIWNIKYKRDRHALICAGYILYHVLIEMITEKTSETINMPPFIIPMPISRARRHERGYNQCELMIKALLQYDTGKNLRMRSDILGKKKNIKKQTFKNRQERLAPKEGVFEVTISPATLHEMKTKLIFVLDDVITTGSTMQAAIDCLYHAGLRNVYGISLAH